MDRFGQASSNSERGSALTFAELAQLLYPYCSRGTKPESFLVELVDHLMKEPASDDDKKKDHAGEYNPFENLQGDTREAYFKGKRPIPAHRASFILGSLDKSRFWEYIDDFSEDARRGICTSLTMVGIHTDIDGVGLVCADAFERVLIDSANRGKKSLRNRKMELSPEIFPRSSNVATPKSPIDLSGFFKAEAHLRSKEFVDRDVPREAFYQVLESQPLSEQNILMYYGIGGIGKSSLIKNLREYTEKKEILHSSVDFDDPAHRSSYKALMELEKNMGTIFPHFDIAVTLYFIKRNPEFSFRDSGLPNQLSREALKILQSVSDQPLYNVRSGLTEKIFHTLGDKFGLNESICTQLSILENCSAADIEEQLPVFFALDLHRHMAIKKRDRCILFFDTYELLWTDGHRIENKLRTDAWVRKMAEMLPNVIFVLSGREKLEWTSEIEIWDSKILHISLDVLEVQYAQQLLDTCGVDDEGVQNSIILASQGHPYYLDLCVDTYFKMKEANRTVSPDVFDGGFQQIQERFFRSLNHSEIHTLRVLSVPRFYDYEIFDMLNSKFQTGYSMAGFDMFNRFSFIKHDAHDSKYIIHALMRDEIKKHIGNDLRRAIDRCMIEYFTQKLSRKKMAVDEIRYYFSELLFHLEASEHDKQILERIEEDYIDIVERLQISGETKYLLGHFLEIFNNNRKHLGGTKFFAIMVDMIHLSGQYREAVKLITAYLDGFEIKDIARDGYLLKLYIRRTHHQMFYEPLKSLQHDMDQIIDLVDPEKHVSHYCEILFMLGAHVFLSMGDFDQSYQYLRRMNSIAKKNGELALLCRGLRKFAELQAAKGNYSAATKIFAAGLKIATENSFWRYGFYLRCNLGEIMRLEGRIDQALKQFHEVMPRATALGIKGWIGHVNLALGNCYTDRKDYESAFEYFDIARGIYAEIGQCWGSINLETAYQRALLISQNSAELSVLERLKSEADTLNYTVLSGKIEKLMAGDTSQIRFEYL